MIRIVFRQLLYLLYLLVVVSVMLEVVLRIYNPLNPRVKKDKIILPVKKTYEFNIEGIPPINGTVVHTKNSLGFRGQEPPKDWSKHLTVLAAGGSTTECFFLNDGKDWPIQMQQRLQTELPGLWVNNAGLNGHSTFGHQVLLDDYLVKLHPTVILFLIGINDVGKDQMDGFDTTILKNVHLGDAWWKDWGRTLANNSEVISLVQLISRGIKTQKLNFHDNVHVPVRPADTLNISAVQIQATVQAAKPHLPAFHERVLKLVTTCRQAGIEPMLITQPLVVGFGIDPITQTNLAKFKLHDTENGELIWKRLEAYNDITRSVAVIQGVHLIDLAREMPKNSLFYYDEMHFTPEGADKVSEILAADLGPYFQEKYTPGRTATVRKKPAP